MSLRALVGRVGDVVIESLCLASCTCPGGGWRISDSSVIERCWCLVRLLFVCVCLCACLFVRLIEVAVHL